MFTKRLFVSLIFLLAVTCTVSSVMKQHYGGNVKISDDLAAGLSQIRLFESAQDNLKSIHGMDFVIKENSLQADLSNLPADKITEIERAIAVLQQESHPCHWILDYPYFHHEHATSISVEKDRLILVAAEPEFLQLLAQSSCMIPERISYLLPFLKTQFGYEANDNSLSGRPFLDSISPVAIDPLNPYLAFKLNEVDVFSIPEEKFREISTDEQIRIQPGLQFFVFIKTENLTAQQMLSLTAVLDLSEISRAVLNDHAEFFLDEKKGGANDAWKTPLYLKVPAEAPFRLIGDRLRFQLENRGFIISTKALPKNAPMLELAVKEIKEADLDLFRYRLLREDLDVSSDTSWFEEWDELEASGKIVPLMLYESRIAVRKNLIDVRAGAGGVPDFSNAWILPAP